MSNAAQDPQERSQAETYLRVFSQSTEYIAHCKVSAVTNMQDGPHENAQVRLTTGRGHL